MPVISIGDIYPGSVLKEDLYHLESGKILLKKNELFSLEKLRILEELKIESLFKGVSVSETEDFLHDINFKPIKLESSMNGQKFATPLYDRKKRILVEADIPLSDSIMHSLKKGGGIVYQLKSDNEIDSKVAVKFLEKLSHLASNLNPANELIINTLDKAEIKTKDYEFDEKAEKIPEGVVINSEFVDNDLIKRKKPHKVEILADATLLEMGVKDNLAKRTDSYKSTFNDAYLDLINELTGLFNFISENNRGKIDSLVRAICCRLVNTLIADKNLVFNLTNLRNQNIDYLVQHSLNVAIFSINIACSLGYSEKQVFELTFGALLSDLGIMKVNKETLLKKTKLTSEERREIEKHPANSLECLNFIKGISTILPYIIYQSHEKLDSSGYPKGRPAHLIHEYSKIIAIADIFDSLCTDRPWRKALIPYKAMEEIIRMAGQKKVDGKIIRKWLFSISLFPVGSYVSLNDKSIAKVISSNPSDFTRPNIRILHKDGENLKDPATIVLNDNKELKITQAIPQEEVKFAVLDGF